jgi:hypothetical protein
LCASFLIIVSSHTKLELWTTNSSCVVQTENSSCVVQIENSSCVEQKQNSSRVVQKQNCGLANGNATMSFSCVFSSNKWAVDLRVARPVWALRPPAGTA